MTPRRVAAFSYAGEQDMLYCHLYELGDLYDHVIVVEADRTHGGDQPKPYHYREHEDRFAEWADKIVYVQATDLPRGDKPGDAWEREIAQREWTKVGLAYLDLAPHDIVFYGDVDEIPTRFVVQYAQPAHTMVCAMTFHPFAVDWMHPTLWPGTVVGPFGGISSLAAMRSLRGSLLESPKKDRILYDAGWHLSWVTSEIAEKDRKMETFCHPEIRPAWEGHLGDCWETGLHVDGTPLIPVDVVPGKWPRWITEGHAPEGWFRPKGSTKPRPDITPIPAMAPPSVMTPSI